MCQLFKHGNWNLTANSHCDCGSRGHNLIYILKAIRLKNTLFSMQDLSQYWPIPSISMLLNSATEKQQFCHSHSSAAGPWPPVSWSLLSPGQTQWEQYLTYSQILYWNAIRRVALQQSSSSSWWYSLTLLGHRWLSWRSQAKMGWLHFKDVFHMCCWSFSLFRLFSSGLGV